MELSYDFLNFNYLDINSKPYKRKKYIPICTSDFCLKKFGKNDYRTSNRFYGRVIKNNVYGYKTICPDCLYALCWIEYDELTKDEKKLVLIKEGQLNESR